MEFFIVTGIALFVIMVVIGVAVAVHSTQGGDPRSVRSRGGRSRHSTWADGGGGAGCGGGSSSCGSGGSSCGGGGGGGCGGGS
ncbi:hypothetical protein ABT034_02825 [Streptomyces sp. NPDC002773]|uniref:hypothetical protein n=1 Tax=Streptomyces sp. NPDC002773 TaxID=3154430 RepID=UPI003326BBC0